MALSKSLTVTRTILLFLLLTSVDSSDAVVASTKCKTVLISGDHLAPPNQELLYPTIIFNFTTQGNNTLESHSLQREVSANEIRENYFTVFHFIPHCSIITIEGPMISLDAMMVPLVQTKVLRPAHDIFILGGIIALASVNHVVDSSVSNFVPHKLARDQKTNRWELGRLTSEKETAAGRTINVLAIAGAQFYRFPTSNTNAGGIYHYMAVECAYRLNVTMNIKATSGSGAKNKEGKWSGAVGSLLYGEADLAFPIGFTVDRQGAIDSSNTLATFSKVFWVKTSAATTTADAILKPFDLTVWLTLLLVIASASPILYHFVRTDCEEGVKSSIVCAASVDIITRLLLEQSTALRRCTGGRIRLMIFMWAILGTVIITGYRSKLYYFLTFTEADPIPRTFQELAFSDYELHFRTYGGVGLTDLLKSKDPVHRRLTTNNRLQLVKSTDECIKQVVVTEGNNAACIDYDFSGDYAIAANASLYLGAEQRMSEQLMKRSFDSMGQYIITWAFPKGSTLAPPFNQVIIWMQASGLYDYWVELDRTVQKVLGIRYLKSQKDSVVRRSLEELEEELTSGPQPLPMNTFMLPLMLICAGGFLALVAFFFENAQKLSSAKINLDLLLIPIKHDPKKIFDV